MMDQGLNNLMMKQQPWQMLAAQHQPKKASEQVDNFGPKEVAAKSESSETEWQPKFQMVDVTSVSIMPEEVSGPKTVNFFGHKIDISGKLEGLKESYIKNYALTKSHNLMVARFAELKTAALGAMLSMLGIASEDIEKLQKKAVRDAVRQNKMLFEENEYNAELISVIGTSKKSVKNQNKVLGEIRTQLLVQARNLGLDDFYSQDRIVEIRLAQCQKILDKFNEEKSNLEYQTRFVAFGVN